MAQEFGSDTASPHLPRAARHTHRLQIQLRGSTCCWGSGCTGRSPQRPRGTCPRQRPLTASQPTVAPSGDHAGPKQWQGARAQEDGHTSTIMHATMPSSGGQQKASTQQGGHAKLGQVGRGQPQSSPATAAWGSHHLRPPRQAPGLRNMRSMRTETEG